MKKEMKYGRRALLLFSVLINVFFSACKEMDGYNDPVSNDKSKPGVVTNIKVENFNGGAHITYSLPNSSNLLYVLAKYKINNNTDLETKSSYYSDTITVEGFSKSQEYEVTLYAVSRANVQSEPVTVKVHPLTPPYLLVKPSLNMSADFGGVNITAANPSKKPVGVIFMEVDADNNADVIDQAFSKDAVINYSIRGYESKPRKFAVYVTDRFGNVSDTTIQTITPLFETQLDKSKFFTYRLASDGEIGYGWDLPYLWNGRIDGNGWHTNSGSGFPIVATFGLGVSAKLSRFVMVERHTLEFAYGHGNPKNFSIWGSNKDQPQNAVLPRTAPVGTVIGDWINLSNYHFPDPPSGNPTTSITAQDEAFVRNGVNFNLPISSPKVKYIRVSVSDTWSGGDFAHIMEMTFFGDPN